MMKTTLKPLIICAMTTMLTIDSFAQNSGLEEYFYASGKIRVVVTVAAIVMIGLLIYVISLDRRLKRVTKKK